MPYEEVSHTQHALKQLQAVTQEAVAGDVAAVAATGVLTIVNLQNAADGETVVINGVTYTFQTTLTNVAGNVLIGVDDDASCANLAAAINGDAGAGTLYAASTNPNAYVTAVAGTNIVTLTAKVKGVSGNAITTTETMAQGSFGGGTLSGGDGDVPVANITTKDAIESVTMFAAGVPSDVSAEASILVDGAIALSTTNATGNTLLVRWLPAASSLR